MTHLSLFTGIGGLNLAPAGPYKPRKACRMREGISVDSHIPYLPAFFAFSGCILLWHASHRLMRLSALYASSGCSSACLMWCTVVA